MIELALAKTELWTSENSNDMKKILFILAIITILMGACKRDNATETTIDGRVEDATTSAPIAGAKVALVKDDGSQAAIVKYMVTDANGQFNFHNFAVENNFDYWLIDNKAQYLDVYSSTGNYAYSVRLGKKNTPIITLQPTGYLKVFIKDLAPIDTFKYIDIVYGHNSNGGGTFYYGEWGGGVTDTFSIAMVEGNQNNDIRYWIHDNVTGLTSASQTITKYCTAFDTATCTINY